MNSNNKNGFSILDLLVKIIFAALLIFIIVWLFQKKMPKINLDPLYSNIYRENVKYMQDAGENYFTDDKMPTEVGETRKLTLEEMEKMNLVIPFVDKDGKSCDVKNSYVTITKLDEGYELKTVLVCGKESNYVIKALGCHTYCPNNNCEKQCHVEKITENQFKKIVTGKKTVYSCPSGYKLNGKNCIKTKLVKSISAIVKTTEKTTVTKPAKADVISGTKTLVKTNVNDKKVLLATNVSTRKELLTTNKKYVEAVTTTEQKPYNCPTVEKVKVPYSCKKTKTENKCTTKYEKHAYQCGNCKTTLTGSGNVEQCDICYKSVPVQTCKEVRKTYADLASQRFSRLSRPSMVENPFS